MRANLRGLAEARNTYGAHCAEEPAWIGARPAAADAPWPRCAPLRSDSVRAGRPTGIVRAPGTQVAKAPADSPCVLRAGGSARPEARPGPVRAEEAGAARAGATQEAGPAAQAGRSAGSGDLMSRQHRSPGTTRPGSYTNATAWVPAPLASVVPGCAPGVTVRHRRRAHSPHTLGAPHPRYEYEEGGNRRRRTPRRWVAVRRVRGGATAAATAAAIARAAQTPARLPGRGRPGATHARAATAPPRPRGKNGGRGQRSSGSFPTSLSMRLRGPSRLTAQ